MGVGTRKGVAGGLSPLGFKIWYFPIKFLVEESCSLNFVLAKWNFITVDPPLEKIIPTTILARPRFPHSPSELIQFIALPWTSNYFSIQYFTSVNQGFARRAFSSIWQLTLHDAKLAFSVNTLFHNHKILCSTAVQLKNDAEFSATERQVFVRTDGTNKQ